MLQRVLYGWNMRRGLYLVMGVIFTWFFIGEKQYMGAGAGVLFAAMALFNLGCAAGNCSAGISRTKTDDNVPFENAGYTEIK
jgi:hypothetical protein